MATFKSEVDDRHKASSEDLDFGNEKSLATTTSNAIDFGEAPDGGLEAWLVAIGAAAIFFCALGYSNAYGVFQQYYITHQLKDESTDNISWIGSLALFFQFASGVAAGPLFDRYGAWVMRPAAVLYVFALMMTSLCDKYWQFMLAQGVLVGLSIGFLQFPVMTAVSQFFEKKRAAALGIAISGSSIGGVVFPIAASKMLNSSSLGFGWSMRILGFIMVPLLVFACVTCKARLPPRPTTFFIGAAFKDRKYLVLILTFSLMLLSIFCPLFFIPSYAVSRGIDPTMASYLLAIVNAASTFGRIIPGILADKFGRLNILSLAGFATGIVILCMTAAKTLAGLVVYSLAIGFASGAIISGASAAFTMCPKDPRDIGTYLGMGLAVTSIAALVGPPINGALVNHYDGFLQVSIFSGVMCFAGGSTALIAKAMTPQGLLGKIYDRHRLDSHEFQSSPGTRMLTTSPLFTPTSTCSESIIG